MERNLSNYRPCSKNSSFLESGGGNRSRGRRRLNDDPREENEGEVEGGVAISGISRGLPTN